MTKIHLLSLLLVGTLVGCASRPARAPDVKDNVRSALDSHGWKDVSVSQDRDKGVVTLTGHVPTDADKSQAASVTQGIAGGQVVSNEIAVTPPNDEGDAKKVNNAIDDGISSNMKALLATPRQGDDVSYHVQSGVVTLTGSVTSQARRSQVEKSASGVANVKQVVNELQVKNQKATSRGGGL
jgi:hyperosmotically inducible protein